jgi:hypothetical protein
MLIIGWETYGFLESESSNQRNKESLGDELYAWAEKAIDKGIEKIQQADACELAYYEGYIGGTIATAIAVPVTIEEHIAGLVVSSGVKLLDISAKTMDGVLQLSKAGRVFMETAQDWAKIWYRNKEIPLSKSQIEELKHLLDEGKIGVEESGLVGTTPEGNEFLERVVNGAGSLVNSLKKLVGKASSINILWKNLDDANIIWSNPNSNVLSTAKSFANETGTSLYDAVLSNGYYVKFDLNDGRILLGNTNGNYNAFAVLNDADLGAFKSSVLNVSDDVFNTKLSQLLSTNADKLKVLSGVISKQLNIAGKTVTLSSSKINTMLGRFRPDVANLFTELGSFKNVGLGEVPGGINVLNRPEFYPYSNPKQWWDAFNYNWLKKSIDRGDDVYLVTKDFNKLTENGKLTSYAYEIRYLIQRNYKPINLTSQEWSDLQLLISQLKFE